MKINHKILGRAIVDTVKPVACIIGIVSAIFLAGVICTHLAGLYAPLVFFGLGHLNMIGVFTVVRYEELTNKHRREQQEIMDILKR